MEPTHILRWVRRQTAAYAPVGASRYEKVLQQKWVCHHSGESEWRDVPTEKE